VLFEIATISMVSTFTPFWRPSSYCRTPGPGSRGWKRPDPGQGGDEECRHA